MATTTCQSSSGECSNEERARTICPFCEKVFSRLGSHLPQCRMRNGEDYSCYLSQKTLNNRNKAAKKTCPQCRRKFVRLDTHLRNSATCRIPTCTLPSSMASPPSSQNDMTPPSLAEHQPAEISATNPSESQTPSSYSSSTACGLTEHQATRPSTIAPAPSQHLPFLKLPQTSQEWTSPDEDLSVSVVPAALSCSTVDEKNETLCEGVYQYFSQRFGTQQQPVHKPRQRRREHQRRLKKLTQQKNEARKKMRMAKRDGLDESTVQTVAQEFHRLLRLHSKESRLSAKSRAKMEALKARRLCAKSFWRFAAQILDGDEASASPTFTADEAESFFQEVYSCEPREFVWPEWLPVPPSPTTTFNEDPITTQKLQRVISQTKSSSTPSPRDQIPYAVLKRYRWLSYMLQNNYMDTTIQKAFVHGIPGCTEHQFKLATAIQEARKKHQSLTICWLDLANAYGSVHHQLIQFTLRHHIMHPVSWSALWPTSTPTLVQPSLLQHGQQWRSLSRLESTRVIPSLQSSSTQ